MQQADMRWVEDGFQPGQPVVMADRSPGQHLVVVDPVEDKVAEPGRLTRPACPEMHPDHAAGLANRVVLDLHPARKVGVGFVRRFQALAGHMEFPTVKQAGEGAVPVVGQYERRLAVRALGVENPDTAVGCAKRHIVFAENGEPDGGAVCLQGIAAHDGQPIPFEVLVHGGAGRHVGQQ